MPDNVLEAENLHLWRGDRHVLRGVSLRARAGELVQIVGANGAGKTSLLRTLAALLHPEEGRITWNGGDVRQDLHGFHGALAYLGHEPPLKADLTARENLRFWAGLRRRVTASDLETALIRVEAREWQDRPARTLSAGQRRRVALAGLMLAGAVLWLLDEPTTHLDAAGQTLVGQLIEAHAAAGGIIIAAVHQDLSQGVTRSLRLELAA